MMPLSGHVAIVDDDAATRVALARLLRLHGLNTRTYPSAPIFLNSLASEAPLCLVVDVNMPEMTGPQLQRELLTRGIRIPTIVITAVNEESVAATAASLGASAFFTKPFEREAFMAAVNSAVERWN